ncbi:lipopolysaccharide biosynthesis protein [Nitrosovibrio sp. Nv17]|uniref:lipopolysaccharide biosynthesis protein n=1 Tax=Nitrosovibrio sp. Nv17 TaxID=1855339 RepID=UPI000908D8D8|nr:lipopolysaccharide biosynthesis protein [Nitrosovibrio sp. Nv17]SFW29849.1 Membrane protein involved in the export of O-antigen and teichoic acid [Nitrosovibrio sp. Nv17]
MTTVRRSLLINGASQGASFLLGLTGSVVVARLLTPEEIGLFSVSLSLIAFGHVFRDFGIGQYLVQAAEISRDRLRSASTMMILISWSVALLFFLARQPAAGFYQNAGIAEILAVLALNFAILPFGAPLLSMLRREMRFDRIALVSISANVVQLAVTVSLALNGFSYMSMAWGSLAGVLATTAILVAMRPADALLMPRLAGMREIFHFGARSSVASLAGQVGSAAPDLIIGGTLGFAEVAFYSRAWGVMNLVMSDFTNIVRGVFFPAFARRVREGASPSAIYLQGITQLTGLTVPLLAVFALLAEPLIHFLFGSQWDRSAPLASLLCAYAMLTAPFVLTGVALVACGKIDIFMRTQLWIQGIRILVISTTVIIDLESMVLVLGLAYCIEVNIYLAAMKKAIGLGFSGLFRCIWRSYALAAIAVSGPGMLLVGSRMTGMYPGSFWQLTIAGILAMTAWLIGVYWLRHPLRSEIETLRRHLSAFLPKGKGER